MRQAPEPPRVLYVYDREDWAIHQVARTWAPLVADRVTFVTVPLAEARAMSPEALAVFHSVILGYSGLLDGFPWQGLERAARSVYSVRHALAREARLWSGHVDRPMPGDAMLRRSMAVVHDPMELFPPAPDWSRGSPWFSRVRRFRRVAVISHQLEQVLQRHGIACHLVHTLPDVAIRPAEELTPAMGCHPLSVCIGYERKNVPLLRALKTRWDAEAVRPRFTARIDEPKMDRMAYQGLLDAHSVYVCTSWQEGGPLPLMESVCRGLAIVTSPVGQVDRWVQHGVNGFICRSPEEFHAALAQLAAEPALLHRMRLASLAIAAERARDPVREQLLQFLAF